MAGRAQRELLVGAKQRKSPRTRLGAADAKGKTLTSAGHTVTMPKWLEIKPLATRVVPRIFRL